MTDGHEADRTPRVSFRPMPQTVIVVGSPTALGGHFGGMERTPALLRTRGLLAALADHPEGRRRAWRDGGDAPNEPGWIADPDPRAKNRDAIAAYLPRLASHVADALGRAGSDAGLMVLGGDCTSHAGALAGIRRARPGARVGVAWFDAHGDFNTPDTTPSGNVWGMPFALMCGRGDPDLLAACDAPSVLEEDAALIGGQVLDEAESRAIAASGVAHFGAGMLASPAGYAAFTAWARVVAGRTDAWYIAFDLDALDASGKWAVAMPEPNGLSLATAVRAVRIIASSRPVAGFGATAVMARAGGDMDATMAAIVELATAALG
jgi:arginase